MDQVFTETASWVSILVSDFTGFVTDNLGVMLTIVGVLIAISIALRLVKRATGGR